MKTLHLFIIFAIIASSGVSCNAQSEKKDSKTNLAQTGEVNVFYFHSARRCITCLSVQEVSKNVVKELYGEKVKFQEYNFEEKTGRAMLDEVGAPGQSLMIVKGESKINITNEGFM